MSNKSISNSNENNDNLTAQAGKIFADPGKPPSPTAAPKATPSSPSARAICGAPADGGALALAAVAVGGLVSCADATLCAVAVGGTVGALCAVAVGPSLVSYVLYKTIGADAGGEGWRLT